MDIQSFVGNFIKETLSDAGLQMRTSGLSVVMLVQSKISEGRGGGGGGGTDLSSIMMMDRREYLKFNEQII